MYATARLICQRRDSREKSVIPLYYGVLLLDDPANLRFHRGFATNNHSLEGGIVMKRQSNNALKTLGFVMLIAGFLLLTGHLQTVVFGAEGKKETGDMKVERDVLAEGKKQMTDGAKMMMEGKKMFMDDLKAKHESLCGETEMVQAEKMMTDGERMLNEGEQMLNQKKIAAGKKSMMEGKNMFMDGRRFMVDRLQLNGIDIIGEMSAGNKKMIEGEKMLHEGGMVIKAWKEESKPKK
jgi:hypothetical protein